VSAKLCQLIPTRFQSGVFFDKFFNEDETSRIRRKLEPREAPSTGGFCKTNLFFGFFFDGTKNNYVQAEAGKNHSNVARLYDCYPGKSVPGVLPDALDKKIVVEGHNFSHFFKVYVPGVASPFPQIDDSGEGTEQTRGAAAGYKGEARILWGLIQAINNVHRYFHDALLISSEEAKYLLGQITLEREHRRLMAKRRVFQPKGPNDEKYGKTRLEFEKILKRLHLAVKQHWPDKKSGKPAKIAPAAVNKIFISIFGFSRGATQARAFTNWLMAVCRLDAELCGRDGVMTLGGFEVAFDFLGLFDTVASIGAGNTLGNSLLGKLFDGHGAWADADQSLRIPEGIRCVHLVAAHEIRRSFPLDSIAVGEAMPAGCDEIVIPGVHSDLGCGYCPTEQGRGTDPMGGDMLARIPLLYMYREARLAGVPLKLEFASDVAKARFTVDPKTIQALNAYLASCKVKQGSLTAIMREQGKHHILWHKARRATGKAPREQSASFLRASNFDKNDLHSANLEFEQEIAAFDAWRKEQGKGFRPKPQAPGFDNEHENEWEEIATWWDSAQPLPASTLSFFDDYVHDSRAWFKLIPGNPDNEPELKLKLAAWEKTRKRVAEYNERESKLAADNQALMTRMYGKRSGVGYQPFQPMKDGLTDDQRRVAAEYAKTQKTPRMLTVGREPFDSSWDSYGLSGRAGYLRFRKIYAGRDSVLISKITAPKISEQAVA
jgi:hypothetical protein